MSLVRECSNSTLNSWECVNDGTEVKIDQNTSKKSPLSHESCPCQPSLPSKCVSDIVQDLESLNIEESVSKPVESAEDIQAKNSPEDSNENAEEHSKNAPTVYDNANYKRPSKAYETAYSAHIQSPFTAAMAHLTSNTPVTTTVALQPAFFKNLPKNVPILSYCMPISSMTYNDMNGSWSANEPIHITLHEDEEQTDFNPLSTHTFTYALYPIVASPQTISEEPADASSAVTNRLQSYYFWLKSIPSCHLQMLFKETNFELHKQLEGKNLMEVRKFKDFVWYFVESQIFKFNQSKVVHTGRLISVDGKQLFKKAVYINLCAEGILINVARSLYSLRCCDEIREALTYFVGEYIKLFIMVDESLRNKGIYRWELMDYVDLMLHLKDTLSSSAMFTDPSMDTCNPAISRSEKSAQTWRDYNSLQLMSKTYPWIREFEPSKAMDIYSVVSYFVMERVMKLDLLHLVKIYENVTQCNESCDNFAIPKCTFYSVDGSAQQYGVYFQRESSRERMHCIRLICEGAFASLMMYRMDETDLTKVLEDLPKMLDNILVSK